MKSNIIILFVIALAFCACNCPDDPKIIYKTKIVYRDTTCYKCLEDARKIMLADVDRYILEKVDLLDSLHEKAMNEVAIYRIASIYQIDTMRTNFLAWQENEVAKLNVMKDSHIVMFDNLILTPDSTFKGAEAVFDSLTHKPKIVFNDYE